MQSANAGKLGLWIARAEAPMRRMSSFAPIGMSAPTRIGDSGDMPC